MLAVRSKPLEAGVLLVPFVDVVLLLLAFAFLVNGLFFGPAAAVDLAPAGFVSTPAASHTLLLTRSGALFLDGRRVELDGLRFGLGLALAEEGEPTLLVRAESGVPSGQLLELLGLVRECGFERVALGIWEER